MRDRNGTNSETLAAQADMFRLAERDYGLTLRAIATETGIPLTTLQSWTRSNIFARARISLPDFVTLCTVIPDELTSLCLAPSGKHVGSDEPTDGDLDALGREAAGFVHDKLDAEEDGIITPIEKGRLKDRARRVAARARAVAA